MCCYVQVEIELLRKLIEEMHDKTVLSDRQLLADETLNVEIKPVVRVQPLPIPQEKVLLLSVRSEELANKLQSERFGAILEETAIELFPDVQGVEVYLSQPIGFMSQAVESVHS